MRSSKAATILSMLLCIIVILPLLLLSSQAATYPYVASKNSKVYHMIECGHAANILESNRVYFATRSAAEASGRRPCSYCGDGLVSEGNGNSSSSSGNSSGNHPSSSTPPSTKLPATEAAPPQTTPEHAVSWWDAFVADYAIFVYSLPALLITIGLYFLLAHIEDKKGKTTPKFITTLFFIFAAAAIPSAVFIFSFVFVFGGLIACIIEGIKALIRYIKACISAKKKENIIHIKIPHSETDKPEEEYLLEAANGMLVWVPESKLDAWQEEQEKQRSGQHQRTPEQQAMIDRIVREIYHPTDEDK